MLSLARFEAKAAIRELSGAPLQLCKQPASNALSSVRRHDIHAFDFRSLIVHRTQRGTPDRSPISLGNQVRTPGCEWFVSRERARWIKRISIAPENLRRHAVQEPYGILAQRIGAPYDDIDLAHSR